MKKVFTFLACALIVFSVSAQNLVELKNTNSPVAKPFKMSLNSPKVTMDTLGWNDYLTLTTQIWSLGYTGGGYVFGNNADGNAMCAQGFYNVNSATYGVTGAMIWFSDIYQNSASGTDIVVNLCFVDDSSSYGDGTNNYDIACPGTVLQTATINISAIDTTSAGANGISFVTFPATAYFDGSLDGAIVIDSRNALAAGDTIGIIGSDEGVASQIFGEPYCWWMYPVDGVTDFWVQTSHVFTTAGSRMPAIFAIVDNDYVGIDDAGYFQGLQLSIYPNPASEILNVAYGVENNANINIKIFSADGKLVIDQNEGSFTSGKYNSTFNISNLAKGNYYLSISSGSGRLTKGFVVE